MVLARATATIPSPPVCTTLTQMSRVSPDRAAPPARLASPIIRTVRREKCLVRDATARVTVILGSGALPPAEGFGGFGALGVPTAPSCRTIRPAGEYARGPEAGRVGRAWTGGSDGSSWTT